MNAGTMIGVSGRIGFRCAAAVALAVWLPMLARAQAPQPPARDLAQVKAQYAAVMDHLEPGGDLMLVANVDGLLKQLLDNIVSLMPAATDPDPDVAEARETITKLQAFLDRSGFNAIRAVGVSSVPRADGLNSQTFYVSRDAAAAALPLWLGLVGAQPRAIAAEDFLPADTVLASTDTADMRQLWTLIRAAVDEVATPSGGKVFESAIASGSSNIGVSVDALIASLGDESFVSIQLSRQDRSSFPMPGGLVTFPEPSLLIGVAVRDDTLAEAIFRQFAKYSIKVSETNLSGTAVRIVDPGMPLPVPFRPAFAKKAGYLLAATSEKALAAALAAYETRSGLSATPAFRSAFAGLPATNNGIFYMDARLMQEVAGVQTQLAAAAKGSAGGAGSFTAGWTLFSGPGPQSRALVCVNEKDGVLTKGTSSAGGRELVLSAGVAPMAMMAAIAIPSFVKARSTSQMNACINNQRQIESAKEQWALANNKQEGDAPTEADVAAYLKGNAVPRCPQSGQAYILNVIGSNCACRIPSHRLRTR